MKISLDLLPQNKKREIKRDKLFREILREDFLFISPMLLLVVILLNVFYLLTIQRKTDVAAYALEQSQDQYRELNKYDEDFKKINEASSLVLKMQNGHLRWANVLNILSNVIPDGIAVDSLATKNYNFYLAGKAKTRDGLLIFKSNLEKESCFKNINIPLSNLVVKEDVDFQMDFEVSQDCLKKSD